MKVAVVGCGAVGSYYGARLCRAGHETHFLLRSDFEAVRRRGVWVRSPEGDFHVCPRAARDAAEIGVADLVLVALKTTANDQFPRLLPPLVGPDTAVLTLQNGLGNEEALAQLMPVSQILGGLCFVCLNRTSPGEIQHLAHGRIVLGEFQRWPEPRTHEIARAIRESGVPCSVTADLARTHWEKLVWNIPFNGLGVASCAGLGAVRLGRIPAGLTRTACLTTDRLLADYEWHHLALEIMGEVIAVARVLGHAIPVSYSAVQVQRTREMGAYRASTLIDFERGQPLELESLFGEPLRQAQAAGVAAPKLERLVEVLRALAGRGPSASVS